MLSATVWSVYEAEWRPGRKVRRPDSTAHLGSMLKLEVRRRTEAGSSACLATRGSVAPEALLPLALFPPLSPLASVTKDIRKPLDDGYEVCQKTQLPVVDEKGKRIARM